MKKFPPSVPTIGENKTEVLCVYEPIFPHFQRYTSMQHVTLPVKRTKQAARKH